MDRCKNSLLYSKEQQEIDERCVYKEHNTCASMEYGIVPLLFDDEDSL